MHKNHRGKRWEMYILREQEWRKSVDLGEEEEWDKSDRTWIWKEYQGTQHTVFLNISPFSPLKNPLLSHHFCAPLLGHISPLVRTPFLGLQLALTHLRLQFLPCPVLNHSLPHSLLLYPQDATSMFLCKSSTYLQNYIAWYPTPTTSRISNPKTKHNWLWLTDQYSRSKSFSSLQPTSQEEVLAWTQQHIHVSQQVLKELRILPVTRHTPTEGLWSR